MSHNLENEMKTLEATLANVQYFKVPAALRIARARASLGLAHGLDLIISNKNTDEQIIRILDGYVNYQKQTDTNVCWLLFSKHCCSLGYGEINYTSGLVKHVEASYPVPRYSKEPTTEQRSYIYDIIKEHKLCQIEKVS